MEFDIVKESEETMHRMDIEADEEFIAFATAFGREHASDQDFFELGVQYMLRRAIARAEAELDESSDDTIGP